MERANSQRRRLILPYGIAFFLFILAPSLFVIALSLARRDEWGETAWAFSFESYRTLLDPLYLKIFGLTVVNALANTLACLLVAYPVAYTLYRTRASLRGLWLAVLMIPFWTSFLVRVLAFMDILRLKPFGIELLYTAPGLTLAMFYNYAPFAVLPVYSAFEKMDPSLLEAARDLGASRWRVFRDVIWPLTKKGAASAALIVFIPSLGEFLIPELVGGGRYFLLGSFLQNQFLSARNAPLGAAALTLLMGLTVVLMLPSLLKGRGGEDFA